MLEKENLEKSIEEYKIKRDTYEKQLNELNKDLAITENDFSKLEKEIINLFDTNDINELEKISTNMEEDIIQLEQELQKLENEK